MRFKYYVGNKVAYLFNTEDNIHLKIDAIIDKDLINDGISLMKKAYNNDSLVYEPIYELETNQNIFTLKDFQELLSTPNNKNYNKYKRMISIDLYNFIKSLAEESNKDEEKTNFVIEQD